MREQEIALRLLVMLVCGGITAAIASSKGRNVVGWFFVGFFFTCIGIVIILCLSNLTEEEEKWAHSRREQHRLQEQLKQERLKNQVFQSHVRTRLDEHDRALVMDTRQLVGEDLDPGLDAPPPLLSGGDPDPGKQQMQQWYVNIESHRGQAIDLVELRSLYRAKRVDEHTLTWTAGMPEWRRIGLIPGLLEDLSA